MPPFNSNAKVALFVRDYKILIDFKLYIQDKLFQLYMKVVVMANRNAAL